MCKITLADREIAYTIKYSKRRSTIQVKVLSSAKLEVIAPFRCPITHIEQLLHNKIDWIDGKTARLAVLEANPVNRALADGAELWYLGRAHTLVLSINADLKPTVSLLPGKITVTFPFDPSTEAHMAEISTLLKKWYTGAAIELLAAKTAFWAGRIGVTPTRISLRDQKTRWGSCSSHGSINYNWRIIMAPPEVMDYLVVHELCHLQHPNHSKHFGS